MLAAYWKVDPKFKDKKEDSGLDRLQEFEFVPCRWPLARPRFRLQKVLTIWTEYRLDAAGKCFS